MWIQRTMFHNARVFMHMDSPRVVVHDAIAGREVDFGCLISTRTVGAFVVRLVSGVGDGCRVTEHLLHVDLVVIERSHDNWVVVMTYGGGDRAGDAATAYAAGATPEDLSSDFDPESHWFGEHRLPRKA